MDDVVEYSKAWRLRGGTAEQDQSRADEYRALCGKVRYVIQPGRQLEQDRQEKGDDHDGFATGKRIIKTSSTIHPGDSMLVLRRNLVDQGLRNQFCLNLYFNDKRIACTRGRRRSSGSHSFRDFRDFDEEHASFLVTAWP